MPSMRVPAAWGGPCFETCIVSPDGRKVWHVTSNIMLYRVYGSPQYAKSLALVK